MTLAETASAVRPGRRVLVIFNPVAGARRRWRLDAVLHDLTARGCTVTLRETTAEGEAKTFAREAADGAWDVVAAAGGDGTINEVINGLFGLDVPLAIIPMGTANVLAAEIGMPVKAATIARVIAEGEARPVHLGLVNGRLFVMMAGVGFDAKVVATVSSRLKRLMGKAAFVYASMKGIFTFSELTYGVQVDGQGYTAASVVVANGHFYGGRFTCAPKARLEKPELYACLFLKPGPWRAFRYCAWLVFGRLHRLKDVIIQPARQISVNGNGGDPIQADGEIVGVSPMTVSLADGTLSVLMPR